MRYSILFVVLGVGLWACQDQVIQPDVDVEASFAKGGVPGKPGGGSGGGGVLTLAEALTGTGQEDMEWSVKKGVFKAYATMDVTTSFSPGDIDFGQCIAIPEGADRASELLGSLQAGLTAIAANVHVDLENTDGASELHRVFSRVGGEVVRYFWVGPRYQFEGLFAGHERVSVSGFSLGESPTETITYTLSKGIVGVRDTAPPSSVVVIGCPFNGEIHVKVTRQPD